jgi:hypothetical protein
MTLLKDLRNIIFILLAFFFLADERGFAATLPQDIYIKQQGSYTRQDLGILKQGLTFQNTHTNQTFTDSYLITIPDNKGVGLAAISVKLDKPEGSYTTFTSGTLSNVANNLTYDLKISSDKLTGSSIFSLITDYLAPGKYEMLINGATTNGTSSYTGNWTIIETDNIAQTPLPTSLYLFLTSFLALYKLQRNKT